MLFYEQYSIGGIELRVEGKHTVRRIASMYGFNRFRVTDGSVYPSILRTDVGLNLPECQWLYCFDIVSATAECRFGIDAEGCYWFVFGDEGVMRYDPRQPHIVEIDAMSDPDILRFVMWVAYSLLALPQGAVPVHSSVVVYNNRAVLCLGESGTGKSTHTRLWLHEYKHSFLLNDDSPIVCIEGDTVMAYGSPWSGKGGIYLPSSYPVAGFLRIVQEPENTIKRLSKIEAFGALQPSCPPALAHDERMMDFIVDIVGRIIVRVPVYRLGCRPDVMAARLSHDTLFPETCS